MLRGTVFETKVRSWKSLKSQEGVFDCKISLLVKPKVLWPEVSECETHGMNLCQKRQKLPSQKQNHCL